MGTYYALWYPSLWLPTVVTGEIARLPKPLMNHMIYVKGTSKRLARGVFHKMMVYQKGLESKQGILSRVVDTGTELFAMSCCCSYAALLSKEGKEKENSIELADLFCRQAKRRIEAHLKLNCCNDDKQHITAARKLMAGKYEWLESDIVI